MPLSYPLFPRQFWGLLGMLALNAVLTLTHLADISDLLVCAGLVLVEWLKFVLLVWRSLASKDNNDFGFLLMLEGFSFGAVAVVLLSLVSSQMSVFSILLWVLDFIACRILCAFAIGVFLYEKK